MQPATNKTHTLTGGEGKGASVYVHGVREATGEEAIEGLTYYTFVYGVRETTGEEVTAGTWSIRNITHMWRRMFPK